MPRKKNFKQLVPLLRGAFNLLFTHPVILFPFATIAFIQLLVLEGLYFFPRYPLSRFFNPVVGTLWGERFIHYPNNFLILQRLFQHAQVLIYLLIGSFLIAVATVVIARINDSRKVRFLPVCREVFSRYIHIFVTALMMLFIFFIFHRLYGFTARVVFQIGSGQKVLLLVKKAIFYGAPYFDLLAEAFIVTVFAFMFPLIAVGKKKIFPAVAANFKHLRGSFWFVAALVVLPTLFYVPVILLRGSMAGAIRSAFPEARVLIIAAGILVMMWIDAMVYTSITSYYLLTKEDS